MAKFKGQYFGLMSRYLVLYSTVGWEGWTGGQAQGPKWMKRAEMLSLMLSLVVTERWSVPNSHFSLNKFQAFACSSFSSISSEAQINSSMNDQLR